MEYRLLGKNSGLKVSCISLGNWLSKEGEDEQIRFNAIMKAAWDWGINFVDTAEVYVDGIGER